MLGATAERQAGAPVRISRYVHQGSHPQISKMSSVQRGTVLSFLPSVVHTSQMQAHCQEATQLVLGGHGGAGKPSTHPARRWLAPHWVYSYGTVPEKRFLKRSKEVNFHQLPGHLNNAGGGRWIDASPSLHPKNSYFLFKELKRRAIHLPTKAGHLAARQESKRNLEFRKHNRQGSQLKKRFHLSSDKRLGVMEEGILHPGETMLKISKMCRRSGGRWWGWAKKTF